MSLDDTYDAVDGVVEQRVFNQIPASPKDKPYHVCISRVSFGINEKMNEFIEIKGEIADGEYEGASIRHTLWFPDDRPKLCEQRMNVFKAFNKLCGLNWKPSALTNATVQDTYIGIILEAAFVKAPNDKKPGTFYDNWYFNELIKGKPAGDTTEREEQGPPPSKPPAPAAKVESDKFSEECDLDSEDPFREEF